MRNLIPTLHIAHLIIRLLTLPAFLWLLKRIIQHRWIRMNLVNTIQTQAHRRIVKQVLNHSQERAESKCVVPIRVDFLALDKAIHLDPSVIRPISYYGKDEPEEAKEKLGHFVYLNSRFRILSRLLQDSI